MRRPLVVILGSLVLVVALAALAWGYSAKVWLMDDFRDGCSVGDDIGEARRTDRAQQNLCVEAIEEIYGTDAAETDSARVFWSGCARGAAGAENDWWFAADYFDD